MASRAKNNKNNNKNYNDIIEEEKKNNNFVDVVSPTPATHRWGIIAPRCGAPAPKGSALPCATGAQRPYVGASAVGYL